MDAETLTLMARQAAYAWSIGLAHGCRHCGAGVGESCNKDPGGPPGVCRDRAAPAESIMFTLMQATADTGGYGCGAHSVEIVELDRPMMEIAARNFPGVFPDWES